MDPLARHIADVLIRYSPPDSGGVYLALADNWPVVQMALTALFTAILITCLAFCTDMLRE